MGTERAKIGWIGQAVIVAIGSGLGGFIGILLAPANLGVGPLGPKEHAAITLGFASCGAILGGLLFSWIKDR